MAPEKRIEYYKGGKYALTLFIKECIKREKEILLVDNEAPPPFYLSRKNTAIILDLGRILWLNDIQPTAGLDAIYGAMRRSRHQANLVTDTPALPMFCDVFDYSKKMRVEVTLHFNQRPLLPVKLIGFYPDRRGVEGIQR
jgi:hypothetical protein